VDGYNATAAYNQVLQVFLYRQLVLQGFNSATFFTFVMPLSEQYVISLFFILSPPIYVYKEWDILIKN
jgi:hypothetical protein